MLSPFPSFLLYHTIMITIESKDLRLAADPDDGMTVCSLQYKGMEMIEADEERKKAGATYGIPMLFPTPNRVKGERYEFNGRTVKGVMHGNLRHSAFHDVEVSGSRVDAVLPFSRLGEFFPYEGKFILSLIVEDDSVLWDISVVNDGDEPFSFGFALHPFFRKREGMRFSSTLEYEMEADEDKIPTGRYAVTDFGEEKDVSSISTDTVFFADSPVKSILSSAGCRLTITGSDDFDHVVVYTAPDKSFICVEPQTCSTDAHNLYSRGFERESGLITVPEHTLHKLWVRMAFD